MITDEELLAVCRSAGEPGTESHRRACRLYRRSVLEYRAQQGPRDPVADLVALLAETARAEGWLGGCGTRHGYSVHLSEGTEVCLACRVWAKPYWRERRRSARAAQASAKAAA